MENNEKISRRAFLAALGAGAIVGSACLLGQEFEENGDTEEYQNLMAEYRVENNYEGVFYSSEGEPLTDPDDMREGHDREVLDKAFERFLGNYTQYATPRGLRSKLAESLYGNNQGEVGEPVYLALSKTLQDLACSQLWYNHGFCVVHRSDGEVKTWMEYRSPSEDEYAYRNRDDEAEGDYYMAAGLDLAGGVQEVLNTEVLLRLDMDFPLEATHDEKAELIARQVELSYYANQMKFYNGVQKDGIQPDGSSMDFGTGELALENWSSAGTAEEAVLRVAKGNKVPFNMLVPLLWMESMLSGEDVPISFEVLSAEDTRRPPRKSDLDLFDCVNRINIVSGLKEKKETMEQIFARKAQKFGLVAPEGASLVAVDTGDDSNVNWRRIYVGCKMPSGRVYGILLGHWVYKKLKEDSDSGWDMVRTANALLAELEKVDQEAA